MPRGDLVLIMTLLFFWGIVLELKLKKIPWRSILGSILALLLALPAIVLNWYLAGVAVPEIRFAWIFRKVMHRYPGISDSAPGSPRIAIPWVQWRAADHR